MESIFYVVFGGIVGGIVSFTEISIARLKIKKKITELNVDEEVNGLFSEVIKGFKTKVPMAGMFLTGDLEEKLKGVGRQEVEKFLPHVKKKIEGQLMQNEGWLLLKGCLLGIAIGALLGAIPSALVRP